MACGVAYGQSLPGGMGVPKSGEFPNSQNPFGTPASQAGTSSSPNGSQAGSANSNQNSNSDQNSDQTVNPNPSANPTATPTPNSAGSASSSTQQPAWIIIPRVVDQETFTDNANDSINATKDDFISSLGVGASITGDTPRVTLDANYVGTYSKYANETQDDHFSQTAHGVGEVTIVPNFVFLDIHALADYLRRDLGSVISSSTLTPSNSVQTYVLSLSPHAAYEVDHLGELDLYYSSNFAWFDGETAAVGPGIGALSNGDQQQAKLEFKAPGTIAPRLFSDVFASGEYTDSGSTGIFRRDESDDVDEYQLTRSLSLVGAGGYEKVLDGRFPRATKDGAVWAEGFRWRPNSDSSVLIVYNHYDTKSDFAGEMQFRLTPITLIYGAYTDSISSTQQQLTGDTGAASFIQNGTLTSQIVTDAPIAGVTFDENPVIATLNKSFVDQENELNGTEIAQNSTLSTPTGVPVLDESSYFPIQNNLYQMKSIRSILYRLVGQDVVSVELFYNHRNLLTYPLDVVPPVQRALGTRISYATFLSNDLSAFAVGGYQVLDDTSLATASKAKSLQGTFGFHYNFGENSFAFLRYQYDNHETFGISGIAKEDAVSAGVELAF